MAPSQDTTGHSAREADRMAQTQWRSEVQKQEQMQAKKPSTPVPVSSQLAPPKPTLDGLPNELLSMISKYLLPTTLTELSPGGMRINTGVAMHNITSSFSALRTVVLRDYIPQPLTEVFDMGLKYPNQSNFERGMSELYLPQIRRRPVQVVVECTNISNVTLWGISRMLAFWSSEWVTDPGYKSSFMVSYTYKRSADEIHITHELEKLIPLLMERMELYGKRLSGSKTYVPKGGYNEVGLDLAKAAWFDINICYHIRDHAVWHALRDHNPHLSDVDFERAFEQESTLKSDEEASEDDVDDVDDSDHSSMAAPGSHGL